MDYIYIDPNLSPHEAEALKEQYRKRLASPVQIYDVSQDKFREIEQADADEMMRLRKAYGALVVGMTMFLNECRAIARGDDDYPKPLLEAIGSVSLS